MKLNLYFGHKLSNIDDLLCVFYHIILLSTFYAVHLVSNIPLCMIRTIFITLQMYAHSNRFHFPNFYSTYDLSLFIF